MMKKFISFAGAALALLMMSSCMKSEGFSYTSTFSRIVTIERKSPVKFVADYTGETFTTSNLASPEQLSLYGLADAERALVTIRQDVDANYISKLTFIEGSKIDILPIYNQELPAGTSFSPLSGYSRIQVENNWNYPYSWITGRYLNFAPSYTSNSRGTHYLQPDTVWGDTLVMQLRTHYTEGTQQVSDFLCYDLASLRDTATAAPAMKAKMTLMLNALEQHRTDSMKVCIGADVLYQDSTVRYGLVTDYFHYTF